MLTNKLNTLIKCIVLLSREIELYKNSETKDYSVDLVKTITNLYRKESKPLIGGDSIIADSLLEYLTSMVSDIESYDTTSILDSLSVLIRENPQLLSTVAKTLNKEITETGLKISIVNLRTQLNNYYRETEVKKRIAKAYYDLNSSSYEGSFKDYINSLVLEIEGLNVKSNDKTPGIVSEIDVDQDNIVNVLASSKETYTGTGKLLTGFKALNKILSGGIRRGETILIPSLPHNYKSGLVQSLLVQLAVHNKPILTNPQKKPLLVYISFEDDADVFTGFMYKYLYYTEHRKLPDLANTSPEHIATYMRDKLKSNGYYVKMLRVNPSDWTYKDLFNYVLKLEADGYELHACIIDYLSKLPPTGCIGKGGVEYRDLFDRCRQFFSAKKIALLTPHQVSTEAKQLIRNNINRLNFVKEIAEKGYTELSKQLDQVVDVEIYIAIANINRKPVLTIQRGKHRGADIMDEKDKYQILYFPYKAPIPPDIDEPDTDVNDIVIEEDEIFN